MTFLNRDPALALELSGIRIMPEPNTAACANSVMVMTKFIAKMGIYLWKNSDEAHAAADGPVGALTEQAALSLGIHVAGYLEPGRRYDLAVIDPAIWAIENRQKNQIREVDMAKYSVCSAMSAMPAMRWSAPYFRVLTGSGSCATVKRRTTSSGNASGRTPSGRRSGHSRPGAAGSCRPRPSRPW